MEVIASLGDNIAEVVGPTYEAYGALLQKPEIKTAINSVKRETFSYGPHERQNLDLYFPPTAPSKSSQKARPVLIFTYGGAFASGDRIVDGIAGGVVYANLAAFFALHVDFETVVLDYRLLRHGAKYPSGGEDLGLGLKWIQERYKNEEGKEIYILANSAGAVHFATWLFEPTFSKERNELLCGSSGARLTKVVLLGCPFRLDYHGGMHSMLEMYYGGEDATKTAEPTALMLAAAQGLKPIDMTSMPAILTVVAELDPMFIIKPAREFSKLWKTCGGEGQYFILKGHNHISPPLSLGTGITREEQWGFQVARWFQGEPL